MKTTNMSKPIRSIQALNISIRELRDKQKTLEIKMDESLMNLKGNYFNMTLNSVFGEKKSTYTFLGKHSFPVHGKRKSATGHWKPDGQNS